VKVNNLSPVQQVDVFIRARYPVLWIVSQEETRVKAAIAGLMETPKHAHKELFVWSITRGIRSATDSAQQVGPEDPIAALEFVSEYGVSEENPYGDPAVFVFLDLHKYFEHDPRVSRALRDVIAGLTNTQRTLIVISPVLAVPDECKRQVAVVEWALPAIEELSAMLEDFIADLPDVVECELNGDREQVARALCGLTEFQAQSVLATAVIATGRLDADAVEFIISEKARLIKESGLLEFYQPEGLPKIGGLDLLKGYLSRRRRSFSDEAVEYGVQMPKGMLLVGVPGCGKSLACKTLASLWKLPLIRLDIGALMGSLVGQSEANLRQALKVAESASPCILWLDEIEKGLSGIKSSGFSDGGTTARVFGTLLTWLQEKTAPVYVVATSNDISALPPELLRAGRFDDIFWVDLPNSVERAEIWQIHLAKTGRVPERFDIDALVAVSDGYTGAEIETAVGDALHVGFDENREIVTDDLADAITARVPLTTTMSEQIDELRAWAARRAKPASSRTESGAGQRSSRAARLDL
jgi:hypothetical protein